MRDSLPAIPDIPEPYQTDRYEEIAYVEFRDEKSTNSRIRMTSKAGFSRSKRRYQSSGLGDRGLLEIAFTGSNFYLCATTQKTFGSLACTLMDTEGNVIEEWTGDCTSSYPWYIPRITTVFSDLEPGTYKVRIETNDLIEVIGAGVLLDQ